MSDANPKPQDPLELLRQMWSSAGVPLPGMMTPTLDVDDLEKRIRDLRTVENWLSMNLGMLQATIQGLEVQRATLNALKAMSEQAAAGTPPGTQAPPNPFAQMWPWNMAPAAPAKPDAASGKPASPRKKT